MTYLAWAVIIWMMLIGVYNVNRYGTRWDYSTAGLLVFWTSVAYLFYHYFGW